MILYTFFMFSVRRPPISTRTYPLFPYTPLFRSPLVVAYAIKGTVTEDMEASPLGTDGYGADVFLKDIWPTNQEVRDLIDANIDNEMFRARYGNVYAGDERWRGIDVTGSETYQWRAGSTYVANPPYFEGMEMTPAPVADIV